MTESIIWLVAIAGPGIVMGVLFVVVSLFGRKYE